MADPDHTIVRRSPLPQSASEPVVTPLYASVVYRCADADALDAQYAGRSAGYTYAREGHPNAAVLARKMDWLEGVRPDWGEGVLTGSGMAALSAVLLGLLRAGDHVLAGDQLYGRSARLLREDLPRLGLQASFADASEAATFEAALRPATRMLLIELVSNPTLRIADLEGIAALARRHGLLLVVDNTFSTPRACQPLARGADLVLHSLTKLLGGHSDATLGYVAANRSALNQALRDTAVTWGLTPSPFDCWLAERGLHTFDLRFERAQHNAEVLAAHLAGLPGVASVLYPGRRDHPDHARVATLLGGNGGTVLGLRLRGGRANANAFLRAAGNIPFAPTLGDVGTTLSHPASSSHRGLDAAARARLGIDEGLIRISAGVEDAGLLVRELENAAAAAARV